MAEEDCVLEADCVVGEFFPPGRKGEWRATDVVAEPRPLAAVNRLGGTDGSEPPLPAVVELPNGGKDDRAWLANRVVPPFELPLPGSRTKPPETEDARYPPDEEPDCPLLSRRIWLSAC